MHINQFDKGIRIESVFLKGRRRELAGGGGGGGDKLSCISFTRVAVTAFVLSFYNHST